MQNYFDLKFILVESFLNSLVISSIKGDERTLHL